VNQGEPFLRKFIGFMMAKMEGIFGHLITSNININPQMVLQKTEFIKSS
jgi:hypothetical protein